MRTTGILMPIFSLASPYGIGTLGAACYEFVDFLEKAGQCWWQILPLNPTNYGDSPYQSFSSAAGNPFLIDLDVLAQEGLLKKEEFAGLDFGSDCESVDYDKIRETRKPLLRLAFSRFDCRGEGFLRFCERESDWLDDYCLFMALKQAAGGADWHEWSKELRFREPSVLQEAREKYRTEMQYFAFEQYEFYREWFLLKDYANAHGVGIIGDMPIYVSADSADSWAHPEIFDLDEELRPKMVAGCPPDPFAEEGQLWGMPVYRWDIMAEEPEPYSWWKGRLKRAFQVYDKVRIDHFRAFDSYYCVKYGSPNAKEGVWRDGPGMHFFHAVEKVFGKNLPIIAEDLGFLTPGVRKLLAESGYPGMKVLQFAFVAGQDSEYLPHNFTPNCVVYTGTHDNDTVLGWTKTAPAADVAAARRYMHVDDAEGFNWAMIRLALMSVAEISIIPMADYIGLGSAGRINTPGTVGTNWKWRIGPGCVNDWLAGILLENAELYSRDAQSIRNRAK